MAALVIGAALLIGCTNGSASEEPTTAEAAPTSAVPLTQPEPEPSEEPSLTPADEAAREAEATYIALLDLQNKLLQSPPEISGDDAEAAANAESLTQRIRTHAFDEMEATLITVLRRYDDQGWRQVGETVAESVRVEEVVLEPADGTSRPSVQLIACLVPQGVDIVNADGERPEELRDVTVAASAAAVRVERLSEADFDGWYVQSARNTEAEC